VPELVVERNSDGTMHLVRVSGDNSRGQSDTRPRGGHGEIGALGENPVRFDNLDCMLDRGPRQRRFTGRLGDEHLHRLEFGERASELVSRDRMIDGELNGAVQGADRLSGTSQAGP
jgi:hypothetical protein